MKPDDFAVIKSTWDRAMWVGTGWTEEVPGGGNADNDGDIDPIATYHKHTGTIIRGPKGPLDKGNK